jgi:hypothetical protein
MSPSPGSHLSKVWLTVARQLSDGLRLLQVEFPELRQMPSLAVTAEEIAEALGAFTSGLKARS